LLVQVRLSSSGNIKSIAVTILVELSFVALSTLILNDTLTHPEYISVATLVIIRNTFVPIHVNLTMNFLNHHVHYSGL